MLEIDALSLGCASEAEKVLRSRAAPGKLPNLINTIRHYPEDLMKKCSMPQVLRFVTIYRHLTFQLAIYGQMTGLSKEAFLNLCKYYRVYGVAVRT
jgi:hypothetical protein